MRRPPAGAPALEAALPHVCVVIPLYKAQNEIADVLRAIPAFVWTIVVVDDASPDDSFARAQAVNDARVHFVRHATNKGVGAAVLSGYRRGIELGADILVKMDADNQMDARYLIPLIAPLAAGEADYTKGNRFLHARQLRSMPLLRRIGNVGLSFLGKLASGYWDIFDVTNGYTALQAVLVPALNQDAIDRRYFFEISLLLELSLLRAVVRDVYIPARYGNEASHLTIWKTLFTFPPRLLGGFLRRAWVHYFLRDFGPATLFALAGTVLLLFGFSYGSYHWWLASQLSTPTLTGTIMLAVLPIILGVQLLLQALVLDVQNVPAQPLHPEPLYQMLRNRNEPHHEIAT